MKPSSRAGVLGIAALLGCAATALDVEAFAADTEAKTIGSWLVSGASGSATAVLTESAIILPSANGLPEGIIPTFHLQLMYGDDFKGSSIFVTHVSNVLPSNIIYHVFADGKDVGQFNNDAAIGGDLRTMFGADLAGLVPVQKLSVVVKNSPASDAPVETFFAANLQQTAGPPTVSLCAAAAIAR